MITEQGKVVAIEDDGVWVETANQSACSRCASRKGCGQSLLAQVDGHRSYVKAGLSGHSPHDFTEGDVITIGIHETAVLRASLLVYCIPLVGLLVGATAGNSLGFVELGVAASAIAGLSSGALGVRWFSGAHKDDERFQPVVIGPATALPVAEIERMEPVEIIGRSHQKFPST